jgi:hypothetical protein
MRVVLALAVWIVAIAGALELSNAVASSVHTSPASTAGSGGGSSAGGSSGGGSSFDASSVKATDSQSLFRTANFTRALAIARAHVGANAQLDDAAVYPGYLDLTVVKAGSEIDFYVDAQGGFQTTNTGGNPGNTTLFSLTKLKADVPEALAKRIATEGGVPESQLAYMVPEVDPISNQFTWLIYPVQGNRVEYFQAPGATGQLLELLANSSTGPQPIGH